DGPTATSCRITTSSGAMCSVATCSKRQRSQQTLSRNRRSASRKLWLPPPVAMLVRPEDVGFGRVAWRGPPLSASCPPAWARHDSAHSTHSPIPTAPPEYTIPSRTTSSRRSPNRPGSAPDLGDRESATDLPSQDVRDFGVPWNCLERTGGRIGPER